MLRTIKNIELVSKNSTPYLSITMENEIVLQPIKEAWQIHKANTFLKAISGLDNEIQFKSYKQYNELLKNVSVIVKNCTYDIDYKDSLN